MSQNTQNNKSYRIKYDTNNPQQQNIIVNLKQKFDFLDIGSLKIDMSNYWKNQSADYGVLVGRVIANGGVGIPNVKISVFIPIDSVDSLNPDIVAIHPYKDPKDIASDGKRYNLLKRVKTFVKNLGWLKNIFGLGTGPKYPRGSRPDRLEIMTNQTLAYIHEKYYKFVTITNDSGDYMITGIPTGVQTIHMDCDLTDIGTFSMKPGNMVKSLGYSENLFDNNGTTVKNTNDLDNIVNIQSQDLAVNIRSFWGNSPDEEIGITRQDFKLKGDIVPDFVTFGAAFTMAGNAYYGDKSLFRVEITNKFLFSISIPTDIYFDGKAPFVHVHWTTYDFNIPRVSIQGPQKIYCDINGGQYDKAAISFLFNYQPIIKEGNSLDPNTNGNTDNTDNDTEKIDINTYRNLLVNIDVYTINSNIDPNNITDINSQISVLDETKYIKYIDSGQFALSIPCNRRRKITNEIGQLVDSDDPNKGIFTEFRGYFIASIPTGEIDNPPNGNHSARVFMKIPQSTAYSKSDNGYQWVTNNQLFEAGKIYSISQYIKDIKIDSNGYQHWWGSPGIIKDCINAGMISNNSIPNVGDFFWNGWLNCSLYFLQYMYKLKKPTNKSHPDGRFCSDIVIDVDDNDNTFSLGSGVFGIRHLLRGDLHPSKFIEIPKNDYLLLIGNSNKGLKSNSNFSGTYPSIYFYKGLYNADCVKYIYNKNLL
jgi:hypothetical protein